MINSVFNKKIIIKKKKCQQDSKVLLSINRSNKEKAVLLTKMTLILKLILIMKTN